MPCSAAVCICQALLLKLQTVQKKAACVVSPKKHLSTAGDWVARGTSATVEAICCI